MVMELDDEEDDGGGKMPAVDDHCQDRNRRNREMSPKNHPGCP